MSWLGALDVVGGNGHSYQLFLFDDGLVCVKPSFTRALPGALIGEGLGGALGGGLGGAVDGVISPKLSKLEAKVYALGADASAEKAADVLPRAILLPLDDIVSGRISGKRLSIKTRKRRLFTGFTHTLGGRLAKDDLDPANRLFAQALGSRWQQSSKESPST